MFATSSTINSETEKREKNNKPCKTERIQTVYGNSYYINYKDV